MEHILDNPIYNALISGNSDFAKGIDDIKYYIEDTAPFAGLKNNTNEDFEMLYHHSPMMNTFVVFSLAQLNIPESWKLITQIDMFQMVFEKDTIEANKIGDYKDLADSHIEEMVALVKLTQPGPFFKRTIDFGNYTGVFDNGKLVAMAGHRFNPLPYREISAVCTHPDHLGKGYAQLLLKEQLKRVLNRGEIPFLHVRNDNVGAIALYQKLGFKIRTEMIAYVIQKA